MLPLNYKIVKKIKVKDLHFLTLFYKYKNNIENIIELIKEKITHDLTFSNEFLRNFRAERGMPYFVGSLVPLRQENTLLQNSISFRKQNLPRFGTCACLLLAFYFRS